MCVSPRNLRQRLPGAQRKSHFFFRFIVTAALNRGGCRILPQNSDEGHRLHERVAHFTFSTAVPIGQRLPATQEFSCFCFISADTAAKNRPSADVDFTAGCVRATLTGFQSPGTRRFFFHTRARCATFCVLAARNVVTDQQAPAALLPTRNSRETSPINGSWFAGPRD